MMLYTDTVRKSIQVITLQHYHNIMKCIVQKNMPYLESQVTISNSIHCLQGCIFFQLHFAVRKSLHLVTLHHIMIRKCLQLVTLQNVMVAISNSILCLLRCTFFQLRFAVRKCLHLVTLRHIMIRKCLQLVTIQNVMV